MALSRLNYNSLNVTPTASKGIGFGSGADDLSIDFAGGAMTFIKKITASADATISFVNGTSDVVLDSTYKEYFFTFTNIHGATDDKALTVGFRDGSTAYDATKTTNFFRAYNEENDSANALAYGGGQDLAQGTGFQFLGVDAGTDNDQSTSGYMYLFNPSSTTFVKHFLAVTNCPSASDQSLHQDIVMLQQLLMQFSLKWFQAILILEISACMDLINMINNIKRSKNS